MAEYQGKRFKRSGEAPASPVGAGPRRAAHMAPSSTTRASSRGASGAGASGVRPVVSSRSRHKGSRGTGGGRRPRRILSSALIAVGILLLAAAGGLLGFTVLGYQQAESAYSKLQELAPVGDSAGDGIPQVDFDALRAINPDVVGWIYVPGTVINYPVVQGDDNDYYLTHLFDGTYNVSGSIFLDADQGAPGCSGQQTTIYGHHMNNQAMFYEIDETYRQEEFDKIETAYYITPDATYRCTPIMTTSVDETNLEPRRENFDSEDDFRNYLMDMLATAGAKADDAVERIKSTNQVLSLVTCNWQLMGDTRSIMILSVDDTVAGSAA